jgi:hypothetical protein
MGSNQLGKHKARPENSKHIHRKGPSGNLENWKRLETVGNWKSGNGWKRLETVGNCINLYVYTLETWKLGNLETWKIGKLETVETYNCWIHVELGLLGLGRFLCVLSVFNVV